MAYQTVFKRYELKYMLTPDQKARVLEAMHPYMELDQYGRTTIRNLYFDTDTYRLIRRSIERPVYKEKLRIRSYGQATPAGTVFVELKKKYESVVYKRRLSLAEEEAMAWTSRERPCPKTTQISREIDYSGVFEELLHRYTTSWELVRVKTTNMGSLFRLTYHVTLRDILKEKELIDELRCRNGNLEITVSKQDTASAEL